MKQPTHQDAALGETSRPDEAGELTIDGLSQEELEARMRPLAKEHPEIAEYMRRNRLMLQKRAEMFREIIKLHSMEYFLLVDLEATCFDDPAMKDTPGDIIEIGAVVLDCRRMEIVEQMQLYTKPTRTAVSAFCTRLTGIAPETVEKAPALAQRLPEVQALAARYGITAWGSYGEYDRRQLERQTGREGLENPFAPWRHVNVKNMVGAYFGFGKKNPGLARALILAELVFEGRHHSGVDDAYNMGRLLIRMARGDASWKAGMILPKQDDC